MTPWKPRRYKDPDHVFIWTRRVVCSGPKIQGKRAVSLRLLSTWIGVGGGFRDLVFIYQL